MRTSLLFVVFATLACATQRHDERETIQFGQTLCAASIDGTVEEQLILREWLEPRALNRVIAWESNDCGEQTGGQANTREDFPICVEATFSNCSGARSSLAVAVGTFKKGFNGPPGIFWAVTGTRDVRTLREFAELNPPCKDAASE